MKKFLAALFLLFLCAPSLAQQSDGGASVLQVRGSTWPGAVLFVSINAPQETTGTWKWAGRSGKLTKAPYGLRTGLAVPLDASEGGQATLKIDLTHADGTEESLERKLTIDKKWRPVQYLSMSSDNEAKYTDPKADEEEVKVFDALEDLQPGLRWKGNFVDPSPAPRSSPFGVRRIRNGRTAGFHRGLDYAGSVGSPIYAPADGKVTLVGPNYTLLGNCVIINHGEGLTGLYMHMHTIKAKNGQMVKKGDVIGTIGNTGASTGPHLHYATYFHGVPVDPDLLKSFPRDWAPELFE